MTRDTFGRMEIDWIQSVAARDITVSAMIFMGDKGRLGIPVNVFATKPILTIPKMSDLS